MTRLAGQLEPEALLAHFRHHLPLGFAPLAGAPPELPAFVAPFDLLTTADDGLKQRLRRLPGWGWWSRWLRIRTAFVGSTVTEYATLPHAADPAALVAGLRTGPARGFRLCIIKDIAQQSPLLPAVDNAHADALVAACRSQGFVVVEGQALAYVPIDFADADAYLACLSYSSRKNLRRKLRSRAGLTITTLPTGPAFADDALVDAYYALYRQVYAQSEVHFDELSRGFFAAVLRDAAAGGVVFAYHAEGALVGWNLCFVHGGKLIDKYIGFAYPQARQHNLYFVSWMVNLEYAVAQGLQFYVAGWTDPEVKAQLGARFTFTRHAVYIRNPLLRALGRRCAHWFESDSARLGQRP